MSRINMVPCGNMRECFNMSRFQVPWRCLQSLTRTSGFFDLLGLCPVAKSWNRTVGRAISPLLTLHGVACKVMVVDWSFQCRWMSWGSGLVTQFYGNRVQTGQGTHNLSCAQHVLHLMCSTSSFSISLSGNWYDHASPLSWQRCSSHTDTAWAAITP